MLMLLMLLLLLLMLLLMLLLLLLMLLMLMLLLLMLLMLLLLLLFRAGIGGCDGGGITAPSRRGGGRPGRARATSSATSPAARSGR